MTLDEAIDKIIALEQQLAALGQENHLLRERVSELERRLSLDIGNSSKPPSSDGLRKKPRKPKRVRGREKRKPGGQVDPPVTALRKVLAGPKACAGKVTATVAVNPAIRVKP